MRKLAALSLVAILIVFGVSVVSAQDDESVGLCQPVVKITENGIIIYGEEIVFQEVVLDIDMVENTVYILFEGELRIYRLVDLLENGEDADFEISEHEGVTAIFRDAVLVTTEDFQIVYLSDGTEFEFDYNEDFPRVDFVFLEMEFESEDWVLILSEMEYGDFSMLMEGVGYTVPVPYNLLEGNPVPIVSVWVKGESIYLLDTEGDVYSYSPNPDPFGIQNQLESIDC